MRAAVNFIAAHPGCSKADVARDLARLSGRSTRIASNLVAGYRTVNLCIAAELVVATPFINSASPRYCLTLTGAGWRLEALTS